MNGTVTLVFDGDCAFCTSTAHWAERRLPPDVAVTPWQPADLPALGLSEGEVETAMYWVDANGSTFRGHLGAAQALESFGGAWRVLARLARTPPTSWLAHGLYVVAARNRHRLPGGTPACRLDER